MTSEVVFQVQQIQVLVDGHSLFPPVSLAIEAGELITVMGPSGCGKSVFLAAISGSLTRGLTVKGDIYLHAKKLNNMPMYHREIAIAYQEDLLFKHLNVAENLLFALPRGGKQQRITKVEQALQCAGLAEFGERDVSTLSGGQKARVSLMRSLLAKPKLLLLDEPFSKLDEQLRQGFREFVYSQIKAMNIPAILVTHDQQDCPAGQFYALQKAMFEEKAV